MFFDRLYKSITPLALALAFAGCSDYFEMPDQEPVPGAPGTLTIQLSNTRGSRSEASKNSENLIDNVIVCLYPNTAAENVEAVATGIFTGRNADGGDKVTMYLTDEMISTLFEDIDGKTCKVFVVANYPVGATLPDKPTIAQLKAIPVTSTFRTVPVQPSFIMTGSGTEVIYHKSTETGTKGTAGGSVILTRAAAKIQLNLKFPESLTVTNASGEKETWVPGIDATLSAMLNRGVQTSVAYPVGTEANPWKPNEATSYYDSDASNDESCRDFDLKLNTVTGTYDMKVPFYTYPNAWSASLLETNTTNITLRVRWGRLSEGETTPSSWVNYYYQVPVTPVGINQIDRNYSYNINLEVGMFGSLLPETPTEIEGSYQIVNWSDQEVPVEIKDFRYLVVNPNVVTIDNEANILIPFYSSHPLKEDMDITMTFQRFNFFTGDYGDVVNITIPKETIDASVSGDEKMVTYGIVKEGTQSYIRINHPLLIWTPKNVNGNTVSLTDVQNRPTNPTEQNIQNAVNTYVSRNIDKFVPPTTAAEIADAEPYSAYVFNIKIQHADNAKYNADIKITQYPAMYIDPVRNPGGGTTSYNGTRATGNVIVNAGYGSSGSNILGTMDNTLSGSNANPNMYIINVSQLSEGSGYSIGDPRSPFTNNNLSGADNLTTRASDDVAAGAYTGTFNNYTQNVTNNWCRRAPALYPNINQRTLTYYYPTIEDKEEYVMMIAPKFRVASSYGKTQDMNRQGARRRMATYQEFNCPAGRWRLPTYGELEYIVKLSGTGKIPILFTETTGNLKGYWTAQGVCRVNRDGTIQLTNSTTGSVRGIYDEWYWEQYPQYSITPSGNNYTYTLGDMPRVIK